MKAAFHILVSGFTQNRGYVHGILKLRESLLENKFSNGLQHRVWYLPWISNYDRVAKDLVNMCAMHGMIPLVNVCGYSYGGWGAVQLCWQLEKSGIPVQHLILSDPVARPWYWPRPLPAASSLLGRNWSRSIVIPDNVRNVHSYYQTENRPQGHRLRTPRNGTTQTPPIRLEKTHQKMDDAPEFHECVQKYARLLQASVYKGDKRGD